MQNLELFVQIKRIYTQLERNSRRRFMALVGSMVLRAGLETFTVGVIAFYAAAISDPVSTHRISFVSWVRNHLPWLPLDTPTAMLLLVSIVVLLMVCLKNIFSGTLIHAISRFSADLEAYFGHRLLENFLNRDYQWHLSCNSADIVQTIRWRTYLGRNFVTPCLKIASEFFVLISLMIGLLCVQPIVSLLFIGMQGGISYLFYCKLRHNLDRNAGRCKDRETVINREVTKAVHGYKEVKITGTSGHFIELFDEQAKPFARDFAWQQFWREAPLLTLETVGFFLICGSILFMLYGLKYSPLEITGTTALLAVAAWRTLPSVNRVLAAMTSIRTALPYINTVLSGLNEGKLRLNKVAPKVEMPFEHELKLEKISFLYSVEDSHQILNTLSLSIKKGQAVGIKGPSGCGKSTLIDIVVGLLQPSEGRVLIDGQPLTPELSDAWVKNLGYVPQTPYIFDGTLAENIAFGVPREEIDFGFVRECCNLAAIDFLETLPRGLDSLIGERGVRLSGGQRQRVSIARALYRKPLILILDEATSALDEENDQKIRKVIAELKGEQTLIIVSHRMSTLADCDLIFDIGE